MFVNITWKRSRKDSVRIHPRSQNATYVALSQRHRGNRSRTEYESLRHRAKSQRTQPFLQRPQPWILHTNQLATRRPLSCPVVCWRRTVPNDCARSRTSLSAARYLNRGAGKNGLFALKLQTTRTSFVLVSKWIPRGHLI